MSDVIVNPCQSYQDDFGAAAAALGGGFKDKMNTIVEKYTPVFKEIENDAPDPGAVGGTFNINFDVDWKDVSIKFDLPEFTMKLQEWKFDIPQVTMKQTEIIFNTPSSRMVTKKVGQYPEFHGFTVVWKDILIDVPEFFMQEQKVIMGIPEFKVDTTSIKLGIPEVTMKPHEIVMGLPQFTLKSVSGEVHTIEARADQAKSSMEGDIAVEKSQLKVEAKLSLTQSANTLFTCLRTQIENKKAEAVAFFDPAVTMLRDVLSKLSSINSDETRKRAAEVQTQLDQAVAQRVAMISKFDDQVKALLDQERSIVDDMVGKIYA